MERCLNPLPSSPVLGPDPAFMATWLASPDVVFENGRVRSWYNPEHPGFPYPEAAGIWLSWVAWRRERGMPTPPSELVKRVHDRLALDLSDSGAVGKNGHLYLFDTCVAIHALARVANTYGEDLAIRPPSGRTISGLERFIAASSPVLPRPRSGHRWSTEWGPHLLRSAAWLFLAGKLTHETGVEELARRLRTRVEEGGAPSRSTYVHALAYGVEGAMMFQALDGWEGVLVPMAEATRLVRIQSLDGTLPAWTDGSGGGRSDATAQTVRIWAALDPIRFAEPMNAALSWLADRQSPDHGIRYSDRSADVNTWATAFADQTVDWVRNGWNPTAWI